MSLTFHIWTRRAMTLIAFSLVLIFTPRAWVGSEQESSADVIPVHLLDVADECLWCEPILHTPDECADDELNLWITEDALQSPPCRPLEATAEDTNT